MPTGFKFQEFYLEKIPPEYIKEKPETEWVKKMVGKLNLSAVYLDEDKAEWTINLFNMENEEEARIFYDQHFSRGKQEIIEKLKQAEGTPSKEADVLQSLLNMSGNFEPVKIGPNNGWLVENKMKNLGEISFRASYYIVTIATTKLGQKELLIQLAGSLQMDKIIKNKEMFIPSSSTNK